MTFWVSFALVAGATPFDLRTREIPDAIPVALLVWAVVSKVADWQSLTWTAIAVGCATGFLLGLASFMVGGLRGGDVKVLTGLGAVLGWLVLLKVVIWIALAGGVLAMIALWRKQTELAYMPAFFIGMLGYGLFHPGAHT